MKSLIWLLGCILTDVSMRHDTDTSRDYREIVSRVKHEGISFLTISLPNFCKDFEESLSREKVDSLSFLGFRKDKSLPCLFKGLTSRVFDKTSGQLLDEPDIDAISSIRQICLMFKKLRISCSEKRQRDAIARYVECDEEVGMLENEPVYVGDPQGYRRVLTNVSSILYSEIGAKYAQAFSTQSLVPKHGPGATADRVHGNAKFTLRTWYERLQTHFPYDSYALPNAGWLGTEAERSIDLLEPEQELPVRVILVPKTLKTPRVISIEPVCMQYAQQSLLEFLVRELERGRLTGGHVNFRDQRINQEKALEGSLYRNLATLDLSEASDRVSLPLVRAVFGSSPHLLEALLDSRSTRAKLPDGTCRSIRKFASMGSALCFPVLSCAVYALAITGILKELNWPVTAGNIKECSRHVYVYGDDVIVPTDKVYAVVKAFELFGLKVNHAKSFWTGKFRESCGLDAYDGVRITPVYLREMPDDGRSKQGLISLVDFCNQLYKNGWWQTAKSIRRRIETLVGPLPHVLETSPGVGWFSYLGSYSVERWDNRTQSHVVRTFVVKPKQSNDPMKDHGALLKFFLSRGKSDEAKSSLHKSVRRGDVHVNRRWVRPH